MSFYDNLMKNSSGRPDSRRLSAQEELTRQMNKISDNRTDGKRLLESIKRDTSTISQPTIEEEKEPESKGNS